MVEKFSHYDAANYLETEEDTCLYLEACQEEGDPALVAAALGMLLILLAGFFKMANLFNVVSVILFILYINNFQIKPEEKALKKIFGEQFDDYCSKVRRWI
ncbi:MAG: hypothetical protein L3J52_02325 [Proteobacteria bacterium]|nr:hypothetical protein [Pseudomonadota bacterium]